MRRLAALSVLLLVAPLGADVAVRQDGMRLDGELKLTKAGQLQFTPQKRDSKTDDVIEYRFAASPPPFRAAPGLLLTMSNGQRLSVVLREVTKDNVIVRTAWAERLELSRAAVVSLTHLPGRRPVFHDDFKGSLTAWATKGEPKRESSELVLKTPGQSAIYTLNKAIDEGRVAVNLREEDSPTGARWLVEAVFARKAGDRTVRVTLGADQLSFDSGGLDGTAHEVAHAKEVRRLFIDFSDGSLRVTVDDAVLWYTLDAGPGGPLKSVRLACVDVKAKPTGAVAFSQFAVERAVPESRHPAGDPRQDELWLADGDQLFGQVVSADRREVTIKGRFGSKRYPWTELRGWFVRQAGKPAVAKAPVVRVGLRGGLRGEDDLLEGTLTALEARAVKLRHPSLGELTLPRDRVAWLRPVVK